MSTAIDTRPSSKVRRVWRIGGSLLTSGALVFAAIQAVVQLGHEERTEVERFDAAGIERIEVDNGAGSVRVVGGGSGTITVTSEVSDGLERTRHRESVDDGVLRLRARCPGFFSSFCDVTYTIETPPSVDLTVHSQGNVTLADIDGAVEVEAWGRVVVQDLAGETTRLRSRQSRVHATELTSPDVTASSFHDVSLGFDEPPDAVQANSQQGGVEVAFPDDRGSYQVDAVSSLGTVTASGIRTAPDSSRPIVARAFGDITLRYNG